jgi:O-antigen/teichoic acid export membrane protein
MSRSRYAAWHYISALATTAVTALTGLVATPLLIRWLGQEQLGAWRVATEWMGYVVLLEACVAPSLQALLTRGVAKDDASEVRRAMSVGLRGYLLLTGLMALVGCGLGLFISRLVSIQPALSGDLSWGWFIGLLAVLLVPLNTFKALVEVRQRGYLINLTLVVQGLLTTGLSVLFAHLGWGLKGQFLAGLLGQLPMPGLLLVQGLRERQRTGFSPLRTEHDGALWREFLALNSTIFVVTLCARLSLNSDNIVASAVLGPAAVVPLICTLRLVTLAQGQVQAIGNASWAALADLHNRKETALFGERLVEATRLTSVLGVAALGPIVVLNPVFISLWVGPELFGGSFMTGVAATNALLQATFSLWVWCFSATGNVRRLVPMYLLSTAINVAGSIGFTYLLGPVGPLLGTLGAFLTVTLWRLPGHLRDTFGVSTRALYHAMLVPLAWGLVHMLGLHLLTRVVPVHGWPALVAMMSFGGLTSLAGAVLFIFTPADRARWLGRLRGVLRVRAA